MTYTPEQRAADGEIALAMGWQAVTQYDGLIGGPGGFPPDAPQHTPGFIRSVPRFHESHDARATLLEWLYNVRGSETFCRMLLILEEIVEGRPEGSGPPVGAPSVPKLMLATPAQVAAAALRVIKESEGGKA